VALLAISFLLFSLPPLPSLPPTCFSWARSKSQVSRESFSIICTTMPLFPTLYFHTSSVTRTSPCQLFPLAPLPLLFFYFAFCLSNSSPPFPLGGPKHSYQFVRFRCIHAPFLTLGIFSLFPYRFFLCCPFFDLRSLRCGTCTFEWPSPHSVSVLPFPYLFPQ